jgi:hypothetical protein
MPGSRISKVFPSGSRSYEFFQNFIALLHSKLLLPYLVDTSVLSGIVINQWIFDVFSFMEKLRTIGNFTTGYAR